MKVHRGTSYYVLNLDEERMDIWRRLSNGSWMLEREQATFLGWGTVLASLPQEFWDDML